MKSLVRFVLSAALSVVVVLTADCASPQKSAPPTSQTAGESTGTPSPTATARTTSKTAATPSVEKKTLFVNEQLVDCQGEGPMKCMQIRESDQDEWTLFYSKIEGFEFEPGYLFELIVEVSPVKKPMADSSSLKYRLVKVVTKRKGETSGSKP